MRALATSSFLLCGVVGIALGCGESEGGSGAPAGGGESSVAGASHAGMEPGRSGSAGSSGSSTAGSSTAGSAASGETGAGSMTGGQPAQAGDGNASGADGGLVDCDPKKILCKRLAPTCDGGQVPSVSGSCYGECVAIERCACSLAADCPTPDEYTCWSKQHCGPFVR